MIIHCQIDSTRNTILLIPSLHKMASFLALLFLYIIVQLFVIFYSLGNGEFCFWVLFSILFTYSLSSPFFTPPQHVLQHRPLWNCSGKKLSQCCDWRFRDREHLSHSLFLRLSLTLSCSISVSVIRFQMTFTTWGNWERTMLKCRAGHGRGDLGLAPL